MPMRSSRAGAGMLQSLMAASMLVIAGRDVLAQDTNDKEAIEAIKNHAKEGLVQDAKHKEILDAIKNHFKTVTAEFWRYKYLRIYGDTISANALTKQEL